MAKGYSARGGFSGGGSAMRQQQMQQKLLKMQQDMAAAQEAVENASFTASVGGGVVQATVSGKKELTALTVKPEAVDPEDVEMLQDLVISAVNEALRQADEAMNSSMQSFNRRSESSRLRPVIPGRKRKGWNRHTIKEATGRHTERRVCPLLLPWKTHLLGVFVIANTVFWRFHRQCAFRHVLLSPVCFSARFVIASAPFRHDLSWPVRISGAPCHRQYVFFDVVCDFWNIYFVRFLPIVWIFSTSSIFILTSKTAAAKGCPLGTAVSFHTFFRIEMISESHLRSGALSKATWSSGRAISPFTS